MATSSTITSTKDETTLVSAVCLPMTALFRRYQQIKYEHLVAGIAGGVVSSTILHPLDTIRTRLAGAQHTNTHSLITDYITFKSVQ